MPIIESLLCIFLLLSFFSVMGLGITHAKTAKNNLALVPIVGYTAIIGLSYFISATLKISGASAVGWAALILLSSFILRIRSFSGFLSDIRRNGQLMLFLTITAIPILSLLFPAILIGIKYFYAFVNFDFFYNSQDSWFLQSHNVMQFGELTDQLVPLNWSANFSGRIAICLLGAFFSKIFNLNALEFNSLLLNTLVIIFSFSICVFSKEFFKLSKKGTLIVIFFTILSAGYVQGYVYYLLGQISVIPVFVLLCVFLKRFLDEASEKCDPKNLNNNAFILAALLNVLFILYAIMSFFALYLIIASYFICFYIQRKKFSLSLLVKIILFAVLLFCLTRLTAIHETIEILKSWIFLSNRVAGGSHGTTFVVFSEYLTENVLALLFGLTNYPSTTSIINILTISDSAKTSLMLGFGIATLLVTVAMLRIFLRSSNSDQKNAAIILISLFGIVLTLTLYFFYTFSGYGIFKLQTWFIPLFIPLYIYFFSKPTLHKSQLILKSYIVIYLILNLMVSIKYLNEFFIFDAKQEFVNARGITGNKDLHDLAAKLKTYNPSKVSIFLTNGIETAWLSNLLRTINIDNVAHNMHTLIEKDFDRNYQKDKQNWHPTGLIVMTNPYSAILHDVTQPFEGGKIIYSNNSYILVDPTQLETLIYLGTGSYPIEYYKSMDGSFPEKFRWIEEGLQIIIYSNKNKFVDFVAEVTPGYVNTKSSARSIIVKHDTHEQRFSIQSKSTLKTSLMLHQGLNYLTIESRDQVTKLTRKSTLIRSNVQLDPRLTNLAISEIKLVSLDPKAK